MRELAPSLLSADFAKLGEEIKILEDNGVKYLHLDVMDGKFVPNISFGIPVIKSIRKSTKMIFDVHLMIDEPEKYIDNFADAGADIITFHYEATKHPHRVIQMIKNKGKLAGISLNPSTNEDNIKYLLGELDLVLIMSVNPGFGGQSFIESQKEKVRNLSKLKEKNGYNYIIEVDGGIKTSNVREIISNGAELIVSGSDVFCAKDINKRINEYNQIFKKI